MVYKVLVIYKVPVVYKVLVVYKLTFARDELMIPL